MRQKLVSTARLYLTIILIGIAHMSYAQCECTDCPVYIPNNATVTSTLNISGAVNNDLGSASQQVCQLCIHFETDAIKELEFILTAPNGSTLLLFEDSGINVNDNYVFDICFVNCTETAVPDPTHSAVFDTNDNWLENSTFTGSYYPYAGCLEDFTGEVNGDWVLSMEDDFAGDDANLLDWYLVFSDDSGLGCANAAECGVVICDVDAGDLIITNSPTCPTEEISFEATGYYDDPDYGQYIIVADENGIIVEVIEGGEGSYIYDYCAVYTVYSYNFDLDDLPVPHVGDNVSTLDCSVGCCEVTEMTIEWADNIVPSFTYLPPHPNFPVGGGPFVEIYCVEDIIPPEDAEFDDNCIGMGTVSPIDIDFTNPCDGGQYFRRWELTDSCHLPVSTAFEYLITVEPTPIAFFENAPDDYTADCNDIPTAAADLTYTNNGTASCNVLEGDASPTLQDNTSPCGGEVLITWSAIDACGRLVEHIQTVTVLPFPDPDFVDAPDDITINCDEVPADAPDLIVSNGELGSCMIEETVAATVEDNTNGCDGTIVYTWVYDGLCDYDLEHTQTITLSPPPIAVFDDPPPTDFVSCDQLSTINTSLNYSNGESGICAINGSEEAIVLGNINPCGGVVTYLWEYIDECGRTISAQQNINILESTPPVFIDVPDDVTLVCGDTFDPGVLVYSNGISGDCAIDGVEVASTTQIGNVITATWTHILCDGSELVATQNATLQDDPTIQISPDIIEICEESSYDLSDLNIDLMGGVNGVITYHFDSPPTSGNELATSVVTPTASTTYTVAVTYPDGCQAYDEVTIILEEPFGSAESAIAIVCDQSIGYNLFDALVNVLNTDGSWVDPSGNGIDDPTNVDISNLPLGESVFQYTGVSINSCLPDIATATLRIGEQVVINILAIECADDELTYSIELETNETASIHSSHGMVDMVNDTVYLISEIPIDSTATIDGLGFMNICNEVIEVAPPDCTCPDVIPPTGVAIEAFCPDESPVLLSAIADPSLEINWYDVPVGGSPVAVDTNQYLALDSIPGTHTYYLEAIDENGCASQFRNQIWFTILSPAAEDTLYMSNCIDFENGESVFTLIDIAQLLELNITAPLPWMVDIFTTKENAELEENEILDDIVVTDTTTIFARVADDSLCVGIVPITLNPIPFPTAILNVTEEICDGGSDGMVAIALDQDSVMTGIDGFDYDNILVYNDLSAGQHFVSLLDSNMCANEITFEVDPGFIISVNNLDFECYDNDTDEITNDDFWRMTFALSTDSGSPSYELLIDGMQAGIFDFGQEYTFDIAADDMLHTILFVDLITGCGRPVSSPVLESCSFPCSVFPDASINLDPGSVLDCATTQIMVSSPAEINVVYTWTLGGVDFDPSLPLTTIGELTLTATDTISGCMVDSTLTITSIESQPSVSIAEPDLLTCDTGMITIDGSSSPSDPQYIFQWSDENGVINGATDVFLDVESAGWYYLVITDSTNSCTNIDSVLVLEDGEQPIIDLQDMLTGECGDTDLNVAATISNVSNYNILWSTSDGNIIGNDDEESISIDEAGTYFISVTNEDNLCVSMDSVVVEIEPIPTLDALVTLDVDCDPLYQGYFQFGESGGTEPLEYFINSQLIEGNELYVSDGIFLVQVIDANGCSVDSIVTFDPSPNLEISLIPEIEFIDGLNNSLDAMTNIPNGNISSIEWTPSDNLSCTDCLSPTLLMGINETYTITIIDINGCEASASINVIYEEEIEVPTPPSDIVIPNIFSPNGDGANDYFVITTPEGLALDYLEVYVFDRWGEQVYFGDQLQSADESAFWDGSYNGSNVNPGVYVYYARAIISGTLEERLFYGDISVVR